MLYNECLNWLYIFLAVQTGKMADFHRCGLPFIRMNMGVIRLYIHTSIIILCLPDDYVVHCEGGF